VVIARLPTLIVNDGESEEAPVESATFTVKVNDPCASGVPVIVTELVVLDDKESPVGRVPEAIDQEKGATPPVAFTAAL